MAVLKNARIYHGEVRLDTDANQVNLGYEAEELDDTVFNDDTRSATGGLKVVTLGASGFWTGGDKSLDDVLFNDVGVSDVPILVSANAAADGDECYFSRYMFSNFTHGGNIGDLHTFDGSAVGKDDPLVRGFVLNESTETSSGTGTAVQVGTVGATETLYGVLHVISVSGTSPTLDVTITGDTSSGGSFATTHLTFTQATTATFGWQTKGGAISDDWFRAEWTVGGTSPSFDFIVAVGIA